MQRDGYQLAELNVAHLVAPRDDARVAGFMTAIDRINRLGMRAPGFVWMLEGSGGGDVDPRHASITEDPRYIINLTVWESVATLEHFVWNTVHGQFYDRRGEWFEGLNAHHLVMWWVAEGHRPTLGEALDRLAHLREHGDSDHAFGWRHLPEATVWRSRTVSGVAGGMVK